MKPFYLLPPSGTPITLDELAHALWSRATSGSPDLFGQKLVSLTGALSIHLVNSGRTAQYLLMKGMADIAGHQRNEVVMPAYTCFSVAASVTRAGLKIRLVDIDPLTMDYRYDELETIDFSNVLAITACNLFGIVSNWERLLSIGRTKNVFLIDDAAQSLGASHAGRISGTFGDGGFYSLDRGKNLSTYAGGVIVTSDQRLGEYLDSAIKAFPSPGVITGLALLVKLLLYKLFLHPRFYWFPNLLPFLGLGETEYNPDFPIAKLSRLQQSLGALVIDRLSSLTQTRRDNARKLAEPILATGRFQIAGYSETDCPAYLRLPVLAPDSTTRDRMVMSLRHAGVMSSTMYPSTIAAIPELRSLLVNPEAPFPGAARVVACLFTLPTHPYVRDKDVARIVSCLCEG
ncbi:MAG: DegT/DnrJ/EryC1/StrS family aminotransferase [Candidatus Zixiibacteriota bacterium]